MFPDIVNRLISELRKLPGIGGKTASRMAFHYINLPKEQLEVIANLFSQISKQVKQCEICSNYTDKEICSICSSSSRNQSQILLVEEPLDALAFEDTGLYSGTYHILGGVISPVNGIGPDELNITKLLTRLTSLKDSEDIELVLALNPNLEGEATANYIRGIVSDKYPDIKISTLARGLPSGADLDYADRQTLLRAFEGRNIV